MSIPIVNAAVPMAEITIMGGANTQNCNSCLNPQNITVSRGTAIEWINKDLVFHDMTSGRPGDADNGILFDSGVILVGKSSIQDFDNVGVFPYFDKKYPWNTGTITVIDSTMPTKHIGYPSPKLASADNQTIVATALSIPELQNWSHDWRFVGMAFLGNNKAGTPDFKWQYAIINLKAPSDSTPIPCNNDWWAWIEIDMTTMKVVQATYPTMESHQCQVAMGGGPGLTIAKNTQPPLQQFKSGVAAKDVTCKENLELILKTKDNSPICVKSDTAMTLIKRGWAMSSLKNFGYNPGRGPVSLEPKDSGNIIANSSSALKLSLSTNSTIIQSGQAVGITISVDNAGPSLLTMNTQNNWPIQGLDSGGCSWLPMGIAILDGYYTAQNMSDGHPMLLHFLYPCPPSLPVKSFTFQPMSSSVITTCESGDWALCQPLTQTKASVAYSSFLQNKKFFNFNSGNYTIVAGDEWGHVAIQHFIVIPPLNDTNPEKPKVTSENKTSSPLQLFLSIDSEYENPAEPISIDIGLNNTGSVPLTLAKSDNWPRNDMGSGLCSNLPFGISILKGYYTEQNMSSAKSLVIYDTVPCPPPTLIKSYTFEPSSSKATQECDTLFSCPGLTDMKAHLVIPDFMYNGQHHSFDVGNYTLVGGDEWGHIMIQHFTEVYTTAYSTPLEK